MAFVWNVDVKLGEASPPGGPNQCARAYSCPNPTVFRWRVRRNIDEPYVWLPTCAHHAPWISNQVEAA
jgi:hypothetical protein